MTSTGGSSSSGSHTDLGASALIGRIVGDYRILREVGKGGMGVVYEAHQISLDRIVALKVLSRTTSLTESSIIRFRREAQAAAKLQHAHIVQIYAQGEDVGLNFYAMEFVQGKSVHQVIVDAREAGGNGAVARTAGKSSRRSSVPGTAGATEETVLLAGTPQWVPASSSGRASAATTPLPASRNAPRTPDQFDQVARYVADVADALEYAHRNGVIHRDIKPHNLLIGADSKIRVSDFGLARVLEQPGLTVTGEFLGSPLYMSPEQISRGDTVVDHRTDIYSLGATLYEWLTLTPPFPGDTREQVIAQILTAELTPPRIVNPDLPVDLETICLKALEKDPARRYATAGALRDDLNAFLQRRAIRARRAGPVARLKKFVLRNRVATMAVLVCAIALSLSAAYVRQRRQHQVVEREQTAQVQEEKARADQAERKNEELRALVEALAPAGWELIQKSMGPTEEELRAPLVALSRRFSRDWLAEFLRSERRRLEQENPEVSSGSSLEYYLSAIGALATGNMTAAMAVLDRCLDLAPDNPHARLLRAVLRGSREEFTAMREDAGEVISADPQNADAFLLRGAANLFQNLPATALDDLAWAVKLTADEPSIWTSTLAGEARLRTGDYAKALEEFQDALAVEPDLVPALLGRAKCLFQTQDYAGAIADTSRAIELEPENVDAMVLRGECYEKLGRFDEALADYARASRYTTNPRSLVTKYYLAKANREVQEQERTKASGNGASGATDESPSGDEGPPPPPLEEEDSEWFQRFLEERLKTDADPESDPPQPVAVASAMTTLGVDSGNRSADRVGIAPATGNAMSSQVGPVLGALNVARTGWQLLADPVRGQLYRQWTRPWSALPLLPPDDR